jgi:hypothetical protein
MAEEVQGTVQGGNGERLELRIGSKSLGFTTKDLVSVLLVVAVCVGFYLAFQSLTDGQSRGFQQQQAGFTKLEHLLELLHTNQAALLVALRENREVTGGILREQNELLRLQTEQLTTNQAGIVAGMQQQTSHLRQWFAILLFKMEHPDQPVSIDMPLPQEPGR